MTLDSIAATTDFSDFSRRPFGAAADLARRCDARLHLVHVVREPDVLVPWQVLATEPDAARARQIEAQNELEDLLAREPAFTGLDVHPQAILGWPARALCEFQKREGVDLLLMASHGHTGDGYFPLGSFAARALQLVACPVLIFRYPEDSGAESWRTFHPRRILVPYDFSHAATTGLDVAMNWAAEFEASLRLLFVVDTGDRDSRRVGGRSGGFLENIREEARARLERLVTSECTGVQAEAAVHLGHPAVAILEEAGDVRADLIVLVSDGRSPLEWLNVGGIIERAIRGAQCPVLLVKHRDS